MKVSKNVPSIVFKGGGMISMIRKTGKELRDVVENLHFTYI